MEEVKSDVDRKLYRVKTVVGLKAPPKVDLSVCLFENLLIDVDMVCARNQELMPKMRRQL